MKLINNRYKIKEVVVTEEYEEGYLVIDLNNDNKKSLLKLYDFEKNKNVIEYYINNFMELSQIRHKNLLESNSFNLVESINLKKSSIPIYYSIAEYLERPVFRSSELSLNLTETLKIVLDLMNVTDFLHFRGFVYQYLNPTTTFYDSDKSVKIVDLSTICEYKINSYFDETIEAFIAPETFIDINNTDIKSDYYSLGMMMKYLLLNDYLNQTVGFKYKEEMGLSTEQMEFLTEIIINLTSKEPASRDIKLRTHIDDIIELFQIDYSYDLINERENFYSKTKIIGRDRELERLLTNDCKISRNEDNYDIAIISGNEGDGKSKLLNELEYRLKMKGKEVYFIDIKENNINNYSNIESLIKETMKNTSIEILYKYREDLNLLLTHSSVFETEKFKVVNKLANYFKAISKNNKIYIIIDNFNKVKDDFVLFLDYIINNTDSSEISFIFGYETKSKISNMEITNAIEKWKLSKTFVEVKLEKLNEEDIGKITKSILGISYIPKRFTSILYKGSQGNPLYLDYIIKHLYNKGELYINKRGHWGLKTEDYSTLPIPSNINKVIEEQLTKIKGKDLNVLKAITVFKDKFTKELLEDILNVNSGIIDITLNNLIAERFIEKHIDSTYFIIENGWKRIMYSKIDDKEREYLHSRTANVLINQYGTNSNGFLEEIIGHLIKAKNHTRTLQFITVEWNKLHDKYGNESIYLCEEAYKLVKNNQDESRLFFLDRLVDLYDVKGNIEKSYKYLKELKTESIAQNNIDYKIKVMVYEATKCLKENNHEKSYSISEEIENISRINNKPDGIIEALMMKCKVVIGNKKLCYIENLLNEAIELSNTNSIDKHLGTIYNLLGFANHIEGNTDIAITNYKQSIEYSVNSNNMLEATKPMNNLGEIYSVNHGDIHMALYYYNRGLELANIYGYTSSSIIFLNNLGELYKNSANKNKALDYFERTRKGAVSIGDYNMIFLANANLGSLYISYNMMDKANNCFTFLNSEFANNPVVELEILIQYYMFLGEYHECYGNYELSLDYFNQVTKLCKGHNIREYLKAKVKIVVIKLVSTFIIDESEVRLLINDLDDAKLFYDKQCLLLYLSILLKLREEKKLSNELIEMYDGNNKDHNDTTMNELRKCLELLLENSEDSLNEIERIMENNESLKSYNTNLYIYYVLANIHFTKGSFNKSTKFFLKSLDIIYKSEKEITDSHLYDKFVKTRKGDKIKVKINEGLNHLLNKKITYKLQTSSDLTDLMNYLPDNIFKNIFYSKSKVENMESLEELISNLTEDNNENINFILQYIGLITLADRGYILQFDESINDYVSVASLVKSDNEIPNESILIQANKSKLGLLLNKNISDMDKSKYYHYLNSASAGIICVPINIPLKSQEIIKDRRKRVYSSNQYNKGYIYLESYGSLNRFDFERLKIINSLSYLIYMNIENNNLKLLSSIDKLTGVFTRKYFEQKLMEILKNINKTNESITILMLDIDNFKSINDTYGHIKGDEVLTQVSNTIKNSIRSTDIVGRYGGEEFIVLLSNSTMNLGKNIAEKIRINIEKMNIPEINRSITISIGLSQYPNHSQFKEELINKADQALYYSKNFMGKNSSAIWNFEMGNSYNRIDKLAGVLTGNTGIDNRNLLTILDMVDLGTAASTFKEKVHLFLGRILDTIDGEYASLILLEEDLTPKPYGTRIRLSSEWIKTPIININKIRSIIEKGVGEYFIDWDIIENVCPITGVPNWESIMIIPLINKDLIKGLVYISVALNEKEFDFNNFNLTKFLCKIFSSNL